MRTIETNVYQFDELNESAKDRARSWFRDLIEPNDYADSTLEDATRLLSLIGVDIRQRPVKLRGGGTRMEPDVYWSVGGGQGDGASYSASYTYQEGGTATLEQEAPSTWNGKEQEQNAALNRIARELASIQRRNFYRIDASISHPQISFRIHRSFSIDVDVSRSDDVALSDADADAMKECFEDIAQWIYRQLKVEYEYRVSDEAVDEDIRVNEYEFTEDGERA